MFDHGVEISKEGIFRMSPSKTSNEAVACYAPGKGIDHKSVNDSGCARSNLRRMSDLARLLAAHGSSYPSKKDAFAARRVLIEAAWSCRFPARIGHDLLLRQEKLSKPVRDMAWKAKNGLSFVWRSPKQSRRARAQSRR